MIQKMFKLKLKKLKYKENYEASSASEGSKFRSFVWQVLKIFEDGTVRVFLQLRYK